jgi:hypothetical protein
VMCIWHQNKPVLARILTSTSPSLWLRNIYRPTINSYNVSVSTWFYLTIKVKVIDVDICWRLSKL